MIKKIGVLHQENLSPYYRRYREWVCREREGLEVRVTGGRGERLRSFRELAARFPVVLFDAFGVLNRGTSAIPGAPATVDWLQARGTAMLVVSNNASQAPATLARGFATMGFALGERELLTSGMVAAPYVRGSHWRELPYYLVGTGESLAAYAPDAELRMVNHPDTGRDWREAEYLLFCSNRDYGGVVGQVEALLREKAVPVLLANPDLVAPDQDGTLYPVAGYTVALLEERFGMPVIGLGKPFAPIFAMAMDRLPATAPDQVLMVGDTLDTDILGGAAMGFRTCLTLSGVHAGLDEAALGALCEQRGIWPDYVVADIGT